VGVVSAGLANPGGSSTDIALRHGVAVAVGVRRGRQDLIVGARPQVDGEAGFPCGLLGRLAQGVMLDEARRPGCPLG